MLFASTPICKKISKTKAYVNKELTFDNHLLLTNRYVFFSC